MLIKNSNSGFMARDAVVLDLGDLAAQAEVIKREASAAAERIVRAAREERERILAGAAEQGRREGRAEGLKQGIEEGREEGLARALAAEGAALKALEQQWAAALEKFESERGVLLAEARASLLRLAGAVAERVTKRHVEADPHVVTAQLEAALRMVLAPTRLVVEVDPADREKALRALPALMERLGGSENAEVRAREGLGAGSVVVRTDRGEIDATISTQLARAVHALLGEDSGAPGSAELESRTTAPPEPPAPEGTRQ